MTEGKLEPRRAGILLPITALPDSPQTGVFDRARRFIDWLADAGASIWQILPMGPPHADCSPYLALSAHAGNPDYIGLSRLADARLIDSEPDAAVRRQMLHAACRHITQDTQSAWHQAYCLFTEENAHWLEDFALFSALRDEQSRKAWFHWPTPLRDRDTETLAQARQRLSVNLQQIKCQQFLFFEQWRAIRRYANERGVTIFGDMPLFVAHDSADVWANRDYFQLNDDGSCRLVAGVPPDYFSSTGQRWGNPHYNWQTMQADGFHWWIDRMRTQLALYDWVRIDHFRGLQAVWEIDGKAETAEQGVWRETPGEALLSTLHQAFGDLPLVAEDLGLITPEVTTLKQLFGLPGMAILQFAFDSGADNPYLPHNLEKNTVIYTGTHDNDTSLSWFKHQSPSRQEHICDYLQCRTDAMPEALVNAALASIAAWAVIPLQDILRLGSGNRTNTPGTTEGNWQWRFDWRQLSEENTRRLSGKIRLYGRKS